MEHSPNVSYGSHIYSALLKYTKLDVWLLTRLNTFSKKTTLIIMMMPIILYFAFNQLQLSSVSSITASNELLKSSVVYPLEESFLIGNELHSSMSQRETPVQETVENVLQSVKLKKYDVQTYRSENMIEVSSSIRNSCGGVISVNRSHLLTFLPKLSSKLSADKANEKNVEKYSNNEEEDIKSLIMFFPKNLETDTREKYSIEKYEKEKNNQMTEVIYHLNILKRRIQSLESRLEDYEDKKNWSIDDLKENLGTLKQILSENKNSFKQWIFETFLTEIAMDLEKKVKRIIKEALQIYDADKINLADYALESGGGIILGTKCSESFYRGNNYFFDFWTDSNSPRTVIQPDVQPGRCWAFKGRQGYIVIKLSAVIYITGFTIDHIPKTLSPSGSIDSAPKNFSVWALDSEDGDKRSLLGSYYYNIDGDPLQYFPVKFPSEKKISIVELEVHSNHGNELYTCLYRFRVHGKLATNQ